jgi:hypothetical protein
MSFFKKGYLFIFKGIGLDLANCSKIEPVNGRMEPG